jgi:glycosyltransferase involved in cell wall biosynthesis
MTSTEALAREIGGAALHVPVPANITPVEMSHVAARESLGFDGKLTVGLFGRGHPSRALDHAEAAIAALAEVHGRDRLAILNLGADAPPLQVPSGVNVSSPGRQTPDELSLRLWASDIVLLPLTDGVSTRRSTLMAALAHGRPVLGCRGHSTDGLLARATDAVVLTPAGDPAAFAREAVELTSDPARMRAVGDAGRRLYQSRFDWPVTARQVADVLERITATRRRVVFVAHDVGGSGGMERHSEQLLRRLVDAGRPVTVIARTCTMETSENMRFVRVRTPRRPAAVGYPAFFAAASLLVARQSEGLVHTTGAIVANRADVSTIHYCHRAARTEVVGSRASRAGVLYRLNSAANRLLSLAGEAWCYRPARTRLLCAVSSGVASELAAYFPAMADKVRMIPNGVDSAVFRPDPRARAEVGAELGVDERAELALFVGGDWERKGLLHAVDALASAPNWHLGVAGAGDPGPYAARARAAGTESRLRFLGPVRDMPRLYAASDAFVLPTAYEAFPLVALEAAASGVPLLVTRVNGAEDLLRDGHNGWLIKRDGGDIARRLNELEHDPELARRMSTNARAAATPFTWDAMANGYVSLYAELDMESTSSSIASLSA